MKTTNNYDAVTRSEQKECPKPIPKGVESEAAFSLKDLVAVVAAASFAILLILPALAGGGDQNMRTICHNNLRQLGQAMLMYASDNADHIAYPNWGNNPEPRGWLYKPVNLNPPGISAPGAYESGAYFRYVNQTNTYLCPVNIQSRYYSQRANKLSSYVMNGAACEYRGFSAGGRMVKVSDVWNPACYLLWEPDENLGSVVPIGAFAYNDASSYPDRNEGVGRLHSAVGAQLLTVSGSVDFATYSQIQTEQSAPNRSLLWWAPSTPSGR